MIAFTQITKTVFLVITDMVCAKVQFGKARFPGILSGSFDKQPSITITSVILVNKQGTKPGI